MRCFSYTCIKKDTNNKTYIRSMGGDKKRGKGKKEGGDNGACSKYIFGDQTGMNSLSGSSPQHLLKNSKDDDLLALSKYVSLSHHR